jgi:hypothetical protein
MGEVEPAVPGELHLDHAGQPLSPGDFVRVVLVGSDEHHRLPRRELAAEFGRTRRTQEPFELAVEQRARGGRQGDAEDLLQLEIAPVAPVPQATTLPCGPALTQRLMVASAACSSRLMLRPVRSSSVWVFA